MNICKKQLRFLQLLFDIRFLMSGTTFTVVFICSRIMVSCPENGIMTTVAFCSENGVDQKVYYGDDYNDNNV